MEAIQRTASRCFNGCLNICTCNRSENETEDRNAPYIDNTTNFSTLDNLHNRTVRFFEPRSNQDAPILDRNPSELESVIWNASFSENIFAKDENKLQGNATDEATPSAPNQSLVDTSTTSVEDVTTRIYPDMPTTDPDGFFRTPIQRAREAIKPPQYKPGPDEKQIRKMVKKAAKGEGTFLHYVNPTVIWKNWEKYGEKLTNYPPALLEDWNEYEEKIGIGKFIVPELMEQLREQIAKNRSAGLSFGPTRQKPSDPDPVYGVQPLASSLPSTTAFPSTTGKLSRAQSIAFNGPPTEEFVRKEIKKQQDLYYTIKHQVELYEDVRNVPESLKNCRRIPKPQMLWKPPPSVKSPTKKILFAEN